MKAFIVSLQAQFSLLIGFIFCLAVSYFYLYLGDNRFPVERPEVMWLGFGLSLVCFVLGTYLSRRYSDESNLDLKQGAWAVVWTWIIGVSISAAVFAYAGFPEPIKDHNLLRAFVDGIFESMAGFTTSGGSILPSVEAFPRSVLMWRSVTHLIGGMGIAFISITLLRNFKFKRETVINSEAEGPNYTEFGKENDAIEAGVDFLKIYLLLTFLLFVSLTISGLYFRTSPYEQWYDNIFDAINHAFSVMGTGGFGTYDTSAGLPTSEYGSNVIGGLRSPVSEWIMSVFMFIAGSNLSLWFILFYKRRISDFWKSTEFKVYTAFVTVVTIGIWISLMFGNVYSSALDALRYAFFNVTTIVSTTGLATSDFTVWPAAAEGLLFSCYLVGGMVGSTAGGLKVLRFVVLYKYVILKIKNLIYGTDKKRFKLDGVVYDESSIGLIMINIVLYFMLFMLGSIAIMVFSPVNIQLDGKVQTMDFVSAITATIANLGNIGPAVEIGNLNAGPAGNYYAFSIPAKLIMTLLMFIGRVGVISFFTIFVTKQGLDHVHESIHEQHFDSDEPILHS